ncbi:hypothetical protein [Leptolyngbya sp. FACHB-17]|uniref:hypothetical protein n=1 Tax=unclassified Leptolyngbya TaxID=2650499 RepID=UPI0016808400|nr:hypothetical protein [Leptolyngbya sp. FACHB-17]MBD2081836.1 hypothetical protein [Leptolyngbya sp. FACHB-17]
MSWKTVFSFALFATLLTIALGWLISIRALPIAQTIYFNDAERRFMGVWIWLAITLGIILPGIAWIAWFKDPQIRKILGLYLATLIIQILTEQISSSFGVPSLVIAIGTVYTIFRIWQIWRSQQLISQVSRNVASRKGMTVLLWILGLFWCSNLIMLSTIGWSSVLS